MRPTLLLISFALICSAPSTTPVQAQTVATPQAAILQDGPLDYEHPDDLGLRVQDVTIREDGIAVMVIRTYAPRPLGSGQLCIRSKGRASRGASSLSPFTEVIAGMVWNQGGDATCSAFLTDEPEGQEMMFNFDSPLGSVNRETDGPLAIVWLRTAPDLQPGDLLDLELVLAESSLLNDEGQPVRILPRNGEANFETNVSPAPLDVTSEAIIDDGRTQVVAWVSTQEELILGSGRLVLTYPIDALIGSPTVEIPWQLAGITLDLEESQPGRIVANITTASTTWGEVPGPLLTIRFEPRPETASFYVGLDPETWLADGAGQTLSLRLSGAELPTTVPLVFQDDFESGGILGWSAQ